MFEYAVRLRQIGFRSAVFKNVVDFFGPRRLLIGTATKPAAKHA